jgi:hypothetical protein
MTQQPEPKLNTENGYTIVVFMPKEAPEEDVRKMFDAVADVAHGSLVENRQGWDPFVFGRAGDVFQIEPSCECCPPHVYLSTSCFHGDHNYCKRETGLLGNKIPGVCKFCQAPCICQCHSEGATPDR